MLLTVPIVREASSEILASAWPSADSADVDHQRK